jgi:hypothetical protein
MRRRARGPLGRLLDASGRSAARWQRVRLMWHGRLAHGVLRKIEVTGGPAVLRIRTGLLSEPLVRPRTMRDTARPRLSWCPGCAVALAFKPSRCRSGLRGCLVRLSARRCRNRAGGIGRSACGRWRTLRERRCETGSATRRNAAGPFLAVGDFGARRYHARL